MIWSLPSCAGGANMEHAGRQHTQVADAWEDAITQDDLVGVDVEVGDLVDIVAGADVRPEEEPIAPPAAGESVVAGTAVELVVAAAAYQAVGAGAAV